MKHKLDEKSELEILSAYTEGESSTILAKRFGVSFRTILNIVTRRGGNVRSISSAKLKYDLDHNFFNTIDSEQKAYLLGLLYADGYNSGDKAVSLNSKDLYLVEEMTRILKSSRPILEYKVKSKVYFRSMVYSSKLSQALTLHGCGKAKTYDLTFPRISDHLISHFIRGYFDGDGCVHIGTKNTQICILGTENMMMGIKDAHDAPASVGRHPTSINLWYYRISNVKGVKQFGGWIYKDASVALPRKRDKFLLLDTK